MSKDEKSTQPKRIIVLQSIEDEMTLHENLRRHNSPFLQNYSIEYCYVIDKNLHLSPETHRDDLLEKLSSQVNTFDPGFLIVHTGYAFRRHPQAIFSALKELKARFPLLIFAIQPVRLLHVAREEEAVDALSQHKDIFSIDDESGYLVEKIFN